MSKKNAPAVQNLLYEFYEKYTTRGDSLKEASYHALKSCILSGKMPAEITEKQIADIFAISRTPVREAMHHLEMDGLLEIAHGKKAMVHNLTQKDIQDISVVLAPLHVLSVSLCIANITDAQLLDMEETLALIDLYTKHKDYEKLCFFNTRFHMQIAKATNNKWLIETLSRLLSFTAIYREYSVSRTTRTIAAQNDHHAIFEAIKRRDVKAAERLIADHVKNAFGIKFVNM